MRTASLNPLQTNVFAVSLTALKIVTPLFILLYGIFHFSTYHWVILGFVVVSVLAISLRVSRMTETHQPDVSVKPNIINADGGTFRKVQHANPQKNARPVVYDGGIVKNKAARHQGRS